MDVCGVLFGSFFCILMPIHELCNVLHEKNGVLHRSGGEGGLEVMGSEILMNTISYRQLAVDDETITYTMIIVSPILFDPGNYLYHR